MRLIEEKRGLSRIKTNYFKQNSNNEKRRTFLKELEKNKEEHIKELEERLGKKPILNLEIEQHKNLRTLLMNQGSSEKSIAELSKWYNLSIK